MTAMAIPSHQVSSSNRLIYHRLKQALKLNLRRQIFIAVCDDLWLRDCLAARLQTELAGTEGEERKAENLQDLEEKSEFKIAKRGEKQSKSRQELGEQKYIALADEQSNLKTAQRYQERSHLSKPLSVAKREALLGVKQTGTISQNSQLPYPRFVSLELNLSDPNPIAQISEWLAQSPAPQKASFGKRVPTFQILGAEHLTRQPAALQWSFLSNLRNVESHLPTWQFNLLLWLPKPWLFTIQQSVPEFWRWHTGVFEFEGEPTPAMGEMGRWGEGERGSGGDGEIGEMRGLLRLSYQSLGVEPLESSNNTQNGSRPKVLSVPSQDSAILSVPSQEFAIPIVKSKIQNPKALELADLVLAAASGELEGGDGISPATGRNFVALQTLQYIELLQEQECLPQTLALAYQTLGNFYRDRILAGDVSRTYLLIAIRAYEMVLEFTSSDAKPQGDRQEDGERKALINQLNQNLTQLSAKSELSTVPDILNDLGTLYWMLSRYPRSPEIASLALSDLEHSIALYQKALAQLNPKTQPQSYARLQKNLGATWGDLARFRDGAQNLQHSVRAYQEALLHIDPDADPQHYAAVENNLGTAYWNLAQHDQPVAYLESAIAAYTKALSYYSPEREPLNYAGVQNNLGTAWWNLAQHEPSEGFLLEAVDAYREALRYRTQELVPAACAATQNNLGTVYWHLANLRHKQGRIESLENAIAAYQNAIAAAKQIHPNQLTFDILAAYNNLGLAHYQLATDPYFSLSKLELRTHLESALQNQLQACMGWQQQMNGSGLAGRENTNSQSQTPNPIYADCRQTALNCIVKTIQAFYSECGLQGQNLALSKLPSDLLPEILQQL